MIENQNLPFQQQHYLHNPEHLDNLRSHVQSLIQHDLSTLQMLLSAVEHTLQHQDDAQPRDPQAAMQKKEDEFKLFQELCLQNRERSQNLSNLSQLIRNCTFNPVHLLDFISEEQHKNEHMQLKYQRSIDELTLQLEQLSNRKQTIQADVQMFREQLEGTRKEMDELLEEHEEERECERQGRRAKENRIDELEGEV